MEGMIEGKLEGMLEGKIEGMLEGKLEIARNAKKMGLAVADIIKLTGLSEDEVKTI